MLVLVIINHDVLLHGKGTSLSGHQRVYRNFLFCIIAYYVSDIVWGVLDRLSLTRALYVDMVVYYVAMASGIFFWTQYVIAYLEEENTVRALLDIGGRVFFAAIIMLTLGNQFFSFMYRFDADGSFHVGPMRNVMLAVQAAMFLMTSACALRVLAEDGNSGRSRHVTIGLFGLIMAVFLAIQLFCPLLPLYTVGCMLGSCLLRTFIIEIEKEDYHRDLEAALRREKQQIQELKTAWRLAYMDSLTGAGSRLAYSEMEEKIDRDIAEGRAEGVAICVFDVNGLKFINDTYGHDAGDRMIIGAHKLIGNIFKNSPVFRIGGDEFATILLGEAYEKREDLLALFNRQIEENRRTKQVVVAAGMAVYIPGVDHSLSRVLKRADSQMYRRKEELKGADP